MFTQVDIFNFVTLLFFFSTSFCLEVDWLFNLFRLEEMAVKFFRSKCREEEPQKHKESNLVRFVDHYNSKEYINDDNF